MGPAGEYGRPVKAPRRERSSVKGRGLVLGALGLVTVGALWLTLDEASISSTTRSEAMAGPSALGPSGPPGTRRPRPVREPAGPAELALVSPLTVGAELADWEVQFIGAVEEGRLSVIVTRDGEKIRLEVMLASDDAPEPAAATRRYHVHYRSRGAHPGDGGRLSRALAEVVAKNGHVEPPPGMAAYEDPGRDPWSDGI